MEQLILFTTTPCPTHVQPRAAIFDIRMRVTRLACHHNYHQVVTNSRRQTLLLLLFRVPWTQRPSGNFWWALDRLCPGLVDQQRCRQQWCAELAKLFAASQTRVTVRYGFAKEKYVAIWIVGVILDPFPTLPVHSARHYIESTGSLSISAIVPSWCQRNSAFVSRRSLQVHHDTEEGCNE